MTGDSPTDPKEGQAAVEEAVARAAALDDYLGGFVAAIEPHATPDPSEQDQAWSIAQAAGPFAGLVDTMLLLRQAAAADGVVPQACPVAPPRRIGRYTILRLAGEGGFATVWEGFDTELRRPVAVKLRRPELLLSESARRRFFREAEIAARLVHPHIVTIYEVGEDAGREFIASEFCSGGSLAGWLDRHPGPLEPRLAARLLLTLAAAAAHAHAAGVIHRDIKPGNVMLAPTAAGDEPVLPAATGAGDRGLTAKLTDFGLGKLAEGSESAAHLTQLTRTGTSIGTPAWMAPEQIDRTFGAVGPATDVHGLGLLLYRLLTGQAPREERTDAETYRQVLLDEPASADRIVRGVPRDLAAVVSKCLAKRPGDRYPTAADLAADLGRWLGGRPTVARPLSPAGRFTRWVRRRPVVASLAAVAIGTSLAAGWAGRDRLRVAANAAEREHELRHRQAVAQLRRGCEAVRAGNVAEAVGALAETRSLDASLADSLAGRWLVRRTHGELAILVGTDPMTAAAGLRGNPPQDLYSIELSPDGESAAVAAADGRVLLLQGLSGRVSVTSVLAHAEVNAVAFSADGRLLATAGQDGRLRWWSVTDRGLESAGEVALAAGPLYAVAFAPDGRAIATGGEDRVVRLVRLNSSAPPEKLFEFEAPPGKSPEVESAVFVDSTRFVASCGDQLALIEAKPGGAVRAFQRPVRGNRNAVLGSLTLAPDGRLLAGCGTDAKAHVWDVTTGLIVGSLPQHPGWVQGCSFSPDGRQLATACRDGGVRVFDAATGRLLNRVVGHVGRVWSVVWEPGGTLLTAGADGTVRRWDPARGFDAAATEAVALPAGPLIDVQPGTASGSGSADAAVGEYAVATGGELWQVDTRQHVARLATPPTTTGFWQAAVDAVRGRLAVCYLGDIPPQVFPLAASPFGDRRPTPIQLPADAQPGEAVIAWTPTGELVLRATDGRLFWCPADLSPARPIAAIEGVVHGLAVAPTGPPRVAACGDRVVIESLPRSTTDRSAPSRRLVLPIKVETTALAWSPDAALIACGTRTGEVRVFDAVTGAAVGSLTPHERMIERILFSPDGRAVISADRDAVRISDAATLTTFDELRPGIEVAGVSLSADGRRLVLAGRAAEPTAGDQARLVVMELPGP